MRILGIETSCDETSAAVLEIDEKINSLKLLSNVTATSLNLHSKTGGIIPEIAAREQLKYILPVIDEALKNTNDKKPITNDQIDAIAVTYGPGLIGSLLVGVETAKTLSLLWNKPLIPVNHLYGHIYANFIKTDSSPLTLNALPSPTDFPAIGLVVSGGHTDLVYMENQTSIKWVAGTRDDAAGECFDKCARLLGYDYPGGPKISELALKGNPNKFKLPHPLPEADIYDFSFSGLKTAFFRSTQQYFPILRNSTAKIGWQEIAIENKLFDSDKQVLYDLCASLQKTIVDVLVKKTFNLAFKMDVKSIIIGGGVSANELLIETFKQYAISHMPYPKIFAPQKFLSTDNGAMIAAAAYFNSKPIDPLKLEANPELYFD